MSSTVINVKRASAEPLDSLAEKLAEKLRGASGITGAELVLKNVRALGEAEAALLVFEKLYLRNGSYSNLTVELTSYGFEQNAVIIGSGGGEGIFNISWGANSDFAQKAYELLFELGFR